MGRHGVKFYRSRADLNGNSTNDVLFQEFLPGDAYDVNLFAYPDGNTKSIAVLLKSGLKRGLAGNAKGVQRSIQRDVAEIALVAVRKLSLQGPIDIDVRRDKCGIPRILDIDARVGDNVQASPEILEEMLNLLPEWARGNIVHVC